MKKQLTKLLTVMLCVLSLAALCFGMAACGAKSYEVTLDYNGEQGSVTLSPAAEGNKYEEGSKVTVTVTAKDGYEVDTFTVSTDAKANLANGKYELTVSADTTVKATFKTTSVAVTEVKLDQDVLGLEVGGIEEEATATLVATVLPDNATDKEVTWTSDNPDVAEVSGGIVTAKAEGKATITATAGGKSATCIVTVTQHVHAAKDATYEIEGNTHFQLCKCGVKVNEAAHSAAEGAEWKQDTANNQHYKECVCGAHVEVAAHSAKDATYQKEDGKHYQLCVCGAHVNEAEHAAADEEEWEKDEGDETTGKHWQICVCGEKVNEGAHEMNPEAFSDGEQGHHYECEKCGFKTETEAHVNESGKWTKHSDSNKGHYYICSVCEAEITQKHILEYYWNANGLYDKCKNCDLDRFISAHEMTKLVSDGAEKGTHHFECNSAQHTALGCGYKAESVSCANDKYMTWTQDAENPGSGHVGTCQCGNQVSVQSHDTDGDDGKCSKCGYKDLGSHVHTDEPDEYGFYDGLCDDDGEQLEEPVWTVSGNAITAYTGSYEKLRVPAKIGGVEITELKAIFKNVNCTDIIVSDSVTKIAGSLFSGSTSLETVILGEKVGQLPSSMVGKCTNLTAIIIKSTNFTFATQCWGAKAGSTDQTPQNMKVYFSIDATALNDMISKLGNASKNYYSGFVAKYYCYYNAAPGSEDKVLQTFGGAWHYDEVSGAAIGDVRIAIWGSNAVFNINSVEKMLPSWGRKECDSDEVINLG